MATRQGKEASSLGEAGDYALEYVDDAVLKVSVSSCVCITCQYFGYASDQACRTILTCKIQQRLIPNGDHLLKRCPLWTRPL